jgi:uncharacterized membrane protein YciS (DUF1049 family)
MMFVYGFIIGWALNTIFVTIYMTLAVKEDRIRRRIERAYPKVNDDA